MALIFDNFLFGYNLGILSILAGEVPVFLFAYSFVLLFGQFDNIYKVERDSLYFFS